MEFTEFFNNSSSNINIDMIRDEWLALAPPYNVNQWSLPLPLWACRPYEDHPDYVLPTIEYQMANCPPDKPVCIYIHIPFCSSKCSFCDSYSFKLGSHIEERIHEYINGICKEMVLWSEIGNLRERPVSTVHLGGGTPTFIGERALTQVVSCCKACFNILPTTEWALESNIQTLTASMIMRMQDLGFSRLHVGVQSLENRVRTEIGRRCSSDQVLATIQKTLELGWIVSVDLLVGLPYQTLEGFTTGIHDLVTLGVNGYSLYELLIYPQNMKWAQKHGLVQRDHLENYWMYQAGASYLESRGYQKNLFNHWVDEKDQNIYFTFPQRGEDCLAIGTIADGVFGDYHYRHSAYKIYTEASKLNQAGLEGGLRQTPFETLMHPLTTAILSGYIPVEILPYLFASAAKDPASMVDHWIKRKLVIHDPDGGLKLTTNGSWFAGNLIEEITGRQRKSSYSANAG